MAVAATGLAALPCRGADDLVTITGGADKSAHVYTWIVTNHHDQRIVRVAFPHYRADLFTPPSGWSAKSTNLVGQPGSLQQGICAATADDPSEAIRPGGTARFEMRVAPGSTPRRGPGVATVEFEDGREYHVDGVEVPVAESLADQYVPFAGLAVIFVLFLVLRALKRGKRSQKPA